MVLFVMDEDIYEIKLTIPKERLSDNIRSFFSSHREAEIVLGMFHSVSEDFLEVTIVYREEKKKHET